MNVEQTLFKDFKSYKHFTNSAASQSVPKKKTKKIVGPLVGSSLGLAGAYLVSKKVPKIKNETVYEVANMLLMAGGANIGGVIGGSIGASKKQKEKKCKEAVFQVMNIAIPMTMVSAALETCKRVKALNNNFAKITGSIVGMLSGAALATMITNATREEGEPYRKYSIKDSISNIDDIIATIKIGFGKILDYVPVDKLLPFIYVYTGVRSGQKE